MNVGSAPRTPGVYFFLSADRALLYVGKAADLRSRLAQHTKAAGGGPVRLSGMYASAAEVRWEEHETEHDAACREADLLVALQPPYNASASVGGWSDVVVGEQAYGTFPHLGPGLASVPGTACTDGYAALLRLLWAAADPHAPAPATRAGVPTSLPHDLRRPLHDLLSGTSRRLLDALGEATARCEPYRQPGLRRDVERADAFFRHGPVRLRDLRRRHALGTGHVTEEQVRAALRSEVRDLLGADVVFPTAPDESLLGRRAARSLHHTTRRVL